METHEPSESETPAGPESTAAASGPGAKNLVERVKGILVQPREEWAIIAAESTPPKQLYLGYIMILAAIGPIAAFIGQWLVGYHVFGFYLHQPFGRALADAIIMYVLTLVGVYVLALVIDALAPTFDGEKNLNQALKVAAYSYTPAWLIAIVLIWPSIFWLQILGLYGLFLLYLGLPVLMKAPAQKALGYTVITIVAMIVIWFLIGFLASLVLIGIPTPQVAPAGFPY
ncbi:MAG: YIP1 family protein [Gammaproteobacteria bacterium]|nr:YIP1 family protein [Gammaproteobacteria bacterium]